MAVVFSKLESIKNPVRCFTKISYFGNFFKGKFIIFYGTTESNVQKCTIFVDFSLHNTKDRRLN